MTREEMITTLINADFGKNIADLKEQIAERRAEIEKLENNFEIGFGFDFTDRDFKIADLKAEILEREEEIEFDMHFFDDLEDEDLEMMI